MNSSRNFTVLMIIPSSGFKEGKPRYSVLIKRDIENLTKAGIKVVPFYLTSRFNLKVLHSFKGKVKAAIEEYSPDVIHIQTGTAGLFLLGSNIKTPSVVTIGGSELLGYPGNSFFWRLRGKLASAVSRLVCKRVDQVIAISQNISSALPRGLKRPPHIIPRAVNTYFFQPMERKIARHKLHWDQEKYYVAFSNPRPYMKVKNRPMAEEVALLTSQSIGREVELAVIYQKTPEQVRCMLNGADALLVTSLHEGSPNILKEAMACNLPVVSVDCGDVKERLSAVNNCFVHSYDKAALAHSLSEILIKRERSNGFAELQNQGLTTSAISKRLINAYFQIVSQKLL